METIKILAVEEDWWDRTRLCTLLTKALPEAQLHAFDNTGQALSFARENQLGAAFIGMGRSIHVPGYFLAKNILEIQKTNIILIDYAWTHAIEAIQLRVSGYIRKPVRYADIARELENLRYPVCDPPPRAEPTPGGGTGREALAYRQEL